MKRLIAICIMFTFLSGCAMFQYNHSPCIDNAFYQGKYHISRCRKIRYGSKHGVHMWCEWWNGKKWVRAEDTTRNVYVADSYSYPQRKGEDWFECNKPNPNILDRTKCARRKQYMKKLFNEYHGGKDYE